MVLSATARFKKWNWLECHCYHYLLLKKSVYKHFITKRFHYSRSFGIFESMADIFYPTEGIKFWNWRRPSGKCTLTNHQESINTSIAEKCGCIMWNQQPFHRFSFGCSWLYCQNWLLFVWKVQQCQHFYLWVDPERWELVSK